MDRKVIDTGPRVVLRNWFNKPFDDAIAAARTCYSSRVISAEEVTKQQRKNIGKSTYEGGHHTIYQHSTFEFAIEGVSRNFVHELHSHPFYNSSQSSQRYVKLKEIKAIIVPLKARNLKIYKNAMIRAWERYDELTEILLKKLIEIQSREPTKKQVKSLEKKAIESARYVIPLAAHVSMVHTVNGLTLFRLNKLRMSGNTPWESNIVISKMIEQVKKIDPLFFERFEDPVPLKETLEYKFFEKYKQFVDKEFVRKFDEKLKGYRSKLVDWNINGRATMANAIRHVMGMSDIDDEKVLDFVLNPKNNSYLTERLNLATVSPLMRTMNHPHFTFRKRISHSCDSQDQRHRMTPASRPMTIFSNVEKPDYITPTFIKETSEAKKIFDEWMKELWEVKNTLVDNGVTLEFANYVLPNALAVRFEESGSLLNLWHKWVLRLCTRSQREIWEVSREEVEQVRKVQPKLVEFVGPKCFLRKIAGIKPYCPEGELTCGKPIWDTFPEMEYIG